MRIPGCFPFKRKIRIPHYWPLDHGPTKVGYVCIKSPTKYFHKRKKRSCLIPVKIVSGK